MVFETILEEAHNQDPVKTLERNLSHYPYTWSLLDGVSHGNVLERLCQNAYLNSLFKGSFVLNDLKQLFTLFDGSARSFLNAPSDYFIKVTQHIRTLFKTDISFVFWKKDRTLSQTYYFQGYTKHLDVTVDPSLSHKELATLCIQNLSLHINQNLNIRKELNYV